MHLLYQIIEYLGKFFLFLCSVSEMVMLQAMYAPRQLHVTSSTCFGPRVNLVTPGSTEYCRVLSLHYRVLNVYSNEWVP